MVSSDDLEKIASRLGEHNVSDAEIDTLINYAKSIASNGLSDEKLQERKAEILAMASAKKGNKVIEYDQEGIKAEHDNSNGRDTCSIDMGKKIGMVVIDLKNQNANDADVYLLSPMERRFHNIHAKMYGLGLTKTDPLDSLRNGKRGMSVSSESAKSLADTVHKGILGIENLEPKDKAKRPPVTNLERPKKPYQYE